MKTVFLAAGVSLFSTTKMVVEDLKGKVTDLFQHHNKQDVELVHAKVEALFKHGNIVEQDIALPLLDNRSRLDNHSRWGFSEDGDILQILTYDVTEWNSCCFDIYGNRVKRKVTNMENLNDPFTQVKNDIGSHVFTMERYDKALKESALPIMSQCLHSLRDQSLYVRKEGIPLISSTVEIGDTHLDKIATMSYHSNSKTDKDCFFSISLLANNNHDIFPSQSRIYGKFLLGALHRFPKKDNTTSDEIEKVLENRLIRVFEIVDNQLQPLRDLGEFQNGIHDVFINKQRNVVVILYDVEKVDEDGNRFLESRAKILRFQKPILKFASDAQRAYQDVIIHTQR